MTNQFQQNQSCLVGIDAVQELERLEVFDKPIIGCHKSTYRDGSDLIHPPLLKIGQNRLGSLFGLTWQEALTDIHYHNLRPIEVRNNKSLWIHFFDGGSIYLQDATRLTKIVAGKDQAILCILGKDRNLHLLYSVFFDTPSSKLTIVKE